MASITCIQAQVLNRAFSKVTGFSRLIKDADGRDQVVEFPYEFKDETRRTLRKWRKVAALWSDEFEQARRAALRDLSPNKDDMTKESPQAIEDFKARLKPLLEESREIPLRLFRMDEFIREDRNPIPDWVLDALEIISEPE